MGNIWAYRLNLLHLGFGKMPSAVEPSCSRGVSSHHSRNTDSVAQESCDREGGTVRGIESYFHLRRATIGAVTDFMVLEVHFNIPDCVMEHPSVRRLIDLGTDMIIWGTTYILTASCMGWFILGLVFRVLLKLT
ncbi:hypothetical protein B0H63DRAFT_187129 [Podospora didyma]|uniref:Uncharacterized protein n=1 Tax=Podospora didyma TaxID=330526 RepID=A0AAE0NQ97_9PEZI|nr:hypothetical protein B0H63DRAFT_187129 [Podospora didyma]